MLTRVKTALRISHTELDTLIQSYIEAAYQELERCGVDTIYLNDEAPEIIVVAVIAYCQMYFHDDPKKVEMYEMSFRTQVDSLRKSRIYGGDGI